MNSTHRIVASLFLAAALVTPATIIAAPTPQVGVQVRVYDRRHRDYHNWDGRENRAWGVYLTNNHRRNYEYSRANRREQDRYWAWRHHNPDRD
jgi:hypothetical protein